MPVVSLYQSRSLGIHVEDLDSDSDDELILEKGEAVEEEEEDEDEGDDEVSRGRKKMQLVMIYSLHLADAIVVASMQPQLYIMLRDSNLCGSTALTSWTGVIESMFAVGSLASLYWGWVGDKYGRRPVALGGLFGIFLSCIVMGFSTSVLTCAILRGISGILISSIRVMAWTMTGDISRTKKSRARNFSRMPLVGLGGLIGPILQAALAHGFEDNSLWKRFPILGSQLACAGLMFIVFVCNFVWLDETLPKPTEEVFNPESQPLAYARRDSLSLFQDEKGVYRDRMDDEEPETPVLYRRRIPVFYNEKPQPISLKELICAPSLLSLLLSSAHLSLHTTTYDRLLPLLSTAPVSTGGLSLPCNFLSILLLTTTLSSALILFLTFPRSITRIPTLRLFRLATWCFPVVYMATPLFTSLSSHSTFTAYATFSSTLLLKSLATLFANTLIPLLVLNASPDPYSLASIMGFLQAGTAVRALAGLGTEAAMGLGEGLGARMGVWGFLTAVAVGGAIGSGWIKEGGRLGRDYAAEQLKWEVCYDYAEAGDV